MAITARLNTTTGIGRATIKQTTRSTIVSQNYTPKPNVSLAEINDVSLGGVQNGQTLVFNSSTGTYEANTVAVPVVNGGTF